MVLTAMLMEPALTANLLEVLTFPVLPTVELVKMVFLQLQEEWVLLDKHNVDLMVFAMTTSIAS